MRKYLYLIKKAKIKSWLKFWLMTNKQFTIVLSEILEGFSFNLQNTVKRYFKIFNIFGNSVQEGEPTPTNPVPIESVADDGILTIKQRGKNLIGVINGSGTQAKVNYSIEDGVVTLNGTSNSYGYINVLSSIKTDGYYTLSIIPISGTGSTIGFRGNSGTTQKFFILGTTTATKSLTDVATCDSFDIFVIPNITYTNFKFKIQLEQGTTATSYEPYRANDYTFQTAPLRSLPNGVKDSLEDDGIHRKIGIQTGTLSQTTTITLSDAKQNGAYMCNIKSTGTLTGQTIELEAGDYEIIYELAEEIIEPYTEEQQAEYNKIKELYTFDGTTNIYSDDEVPPYLKIQYYMKEE